MVRSRGDGALEFVGRLDNQVKVRGFRIELEEIESALGGYPDLAESVVVAHEEGSDDKMLVAYYRPPEKRPTLESLRAYLSARLPSYMIPAHFIELAQFPLLVNGKIDRLALGGRGLPTEESAAPSEFSEDPIAIELLAIWRRILRLPSMQPTDNFFEVGGHSLLAARLFGEIRSRLREETPSGDAIRRTHGREPRPCHREHGRAGMVAAGPHPDDRRRQALLLRTSYRRERPYF